MEVGLYINRRKGEFLCGKGFFLMYFCFILSGKIHIAYLEAYFRRIYTKKGE